MKKALLIIFLTFSIQTFSQKTVNVKIDPRIEAISIFYTLATRDTLVRKPTPSTYYKDFDKYFENHKNHKSLNWYRNLESWDGFDLSSIGLYFSNAYPFKLKIPYTGTQLRSSDMATFIVNFNEFYKDCQVETFIKSHQKEYARISEFAKKSIVESNVLNDAQKFFNKPSTGEIIIFADVLNNLGSNAIVINDKRFKRKKMFKLAYLNVDTVNQTAQSKVKFIPLSNVVIHEISHLYVSDFIPTFKERLRNKKELFLTTSKNKLLEETEWENELDELIVRVAVSKILGERYGTEIELEEIENQSKHYKHFKELNLFFANYTGNRNKYKTITDFYPEIMKFIETLE